MNEKFYFVVLVCGAVFPKIDVLV